MRTWASGAAIVGAAILLAGCASIDVAGPMRSIEQQVQERIDAPVPEWSEQWHTEGSATIAIPKGTILERDDAVRLTLAYNPGLRALLEEVGFAAADLAEAGLLSNPSLHVSARSPEGGHSGTNVELALAQNLLKIFTLRQSERLATSELEETRLRIAHAVLEIAQEAELAYLDLVAAEQLLELRRTIVDASRASLELAQRFRDAGNISELQLRREQALFETAAVDYLGAQRSLAGARRGLRDLLGTWGTSESNWSVEPRLADIPAEEVALGALETHAVRQRLDLQAALQEVETLELALGITRRFRLLGGLEIEASAERELDGLWVVGPGIDVELPIFNSGRARVARAQGALRQAQRRLEALAVAIRSEVLLLRQEVLLQKTTAERYLTRVIPNRERTVQLAQQRYNYMLAGIFEVLESKQREYEAYERYIETVRDYWKAKTRLRFAVGGRFPDGADASDSFDQAAADAGPAASETSP